MIIDETEVITALRNAKKVLLLEPPYKRHYIPLGLAKISTFVKDNGGEAVYARGIVGNYFDLICMTTCFTTDSKVVFQVLKELRTGLFLRNTRIIIGGVFATLMPKFIMDNNPGVDVFVGCSDILDDCLPDYSLSETLKGWFKDIMILFTTRGCPNNCEYCMVPKMEPKLKILPSWKRNLEQIDRKDCIVFDNNLLAFPIKHFTNLVKVLNEQKKRVLFDNGIDCRLVNDESAKLLASLKYFHNGFRMAFDRMSDDGHYQNAMEKVIAAGLKVKSNSYTYVLYNFNDTPQEAYYRVKESWKYGSNPYFMKYRPLDAMGKSDFIGKHWTKNLLRAFGNYGMNFGYNCGDGTFEQWVKNSHERWASKSQMNDEDWEKWNYKKGVI